MQERCRRHYSAQTIFACRRSAGWRRCSLEDSAMAETAYQRPKRLPVAVYDLAMRLDINPGSTVHNHAAQAIGPGASG